MNPATTKRVLKALPSSLGVMTVPVALSDMPIGTADHPDLVHLIDRVIDQDELALAQLYDLTSSRVYGLVLRITRHAALAEEAVEDTYFQVWRQAVRFDGLRGNVTAWLLTIARSRALDLIRRESRFDHEELSDITDSIAMESEQRGPDELVAAARDHQKLHEAMTILGAQSRQLVALAFFKGLSHEEIAQSTNLPLGTVKSQIRRALNLLKAALYGVHHSALPSNDRPA